MIITMFELGLCALLMLIMIRGYVVLINQKRILDAIYDYRYFAIVNDISPEVDFDDMESSSDTFWRLWDWGYKRILPRSKYEKIKCYIVNKKKRR